MNSSRVLALYSLGLDFEEVKLSPYCPLWSVIFQAEKRRIEAGLPGIRSSINPSSTTIEHVGSTSVPGCFAKPVMDMIACYQQEEERDAIVTGLMALDYLYLGQCGRQGRDFFVLNRGRQTLFHLHLVPTGHPLVQDLLSFRHHLMTSLAERNRYIRFKRELAERFPNDRARYRVYKAMFFD